jgi:hypothetical protein
MTVKYFEIRDRYTTIAALAISIEGGDSWLARHAGFRERMILLVQLYAEKCCWDPYHWDNRTMHNAHCYIAENWDSLENEAVIDVEFILGESQTIKASDRGGY